jgi:signal peptidase I
MEPESSHAEPCRQVHRSRPWRSIGRELLAWSRALASAGVYATLIVTFGFQVARVEGHSMEPTLHDQDRLVVNKLAYQIQSPARGEVVMLLHPNDPSQALVKRVVAEPGDTIAMRNGAVIVNDVVLSEPYVISDHRSFDDRAAMLVPEGFYFVLGDHRNNSTDSRIFGPVPARYILGRVQVRWWPVTESLWP